MTLAAPATRSAAPTQRQARQAHIFDVAIGLFEAAGYEAVSIEEICLKAGVARATFFRLFGGKAGLIEEANRRTAGLVQARVAAAQARGRAAICLMGETIAWAWLAAGAPIYAMFEAFSGPGYAIGGLAEVEIDASRDGSRALTRLAAGYVAQGQADGDFRADLDPQAMGLSVMSMLITACGVWVARDERRSDAFAARVDQAVSVMVRGMAR